MSKIITLSEKSLRDCGFKHWEKVDDVAEYFDVPREEVIEEIGKIGSLVNRVLSRGRNHVYFQMPLSEKGIREDEPVTNVKSLKELVSLGLAAYRSWQGEESSKLMIRDGRREYRWAPSHLIPEEVIYSMREEVY